MSKKILKNNHQITTTKPLLMKRGVRCPPTKKYLKKYKDGSSIRILYSSKYIRKNKFHNRYREVQKEECKTMKLKKIYMMNKKTEEKVEENRKGGKRRRNV